LVEDTGDDRHVLLTYDRGVLEFMSPGIEHEDSKGRLDRLVEIVTEELGIPCKGYGSTTWLCAEAERGIEPDECYYLTPDKVARAHELRRQKVKDTSAYPAPDLAIEIDISRSSLGRHAIYATLGVPEVWSFDGTRLRIALLNDDGVYTPTVVGNFIPLPSEDITRWVLAEMADDSEWAHALRDWIRNQRTGG